MDGERNDNGGATARGFTDGGPETWNPRDWTPTSPARLNISPTIRALFPAAVRGDDGAIRARAHRAQMAALNVAGAGGDILRKYMCVLRWAFLMPRMHLHPSFDRLIPDVRQLAGPLVDLGCCMGADLRYLVTRGAAPTRLLGLDYSATFLEAGNILWGPPEDPAVDCMFYRCDFLSVDNTPADCVRRRWGAHSCGAALVHAGSVLHTFDDAAHVRLVCRRVFDMLAPSGCFFGSNRPVWVFGPPAAFKRMLEELGFVEAVVERREIDLSARRLSSGPNAIVVKDGWAPTWFEAFKPAEKGRHPDAKL